jgi:hypothetical protein
MASTGVSFWSHQAGVEVWNPPDSITERCATSANPQTCVTRNTRKYALSVGWDLTGIDQGHILAKSHGGGANVRNILPQMASPNRRRGNRHDQLHCVEVGPDKCSVCVYVLFSLCYVALNSTK